MKLVITRYPVCGNKVHWVCLSGRDSCSSLELPSLTSPGIYLPHSWKENMQQNKTLTHSLVCLDLEKSKKSWLFLYWVSIVKDMALQRKVILRLTLKVKFKAGVQCLCWRRPWWTLLWCNQGLLLTHPFIEIKEFCEAVEFFFEMRLAITS